MPELTDKILLLESFEGTVAKMETYLCQLGQIGAFDKVAGIILGTFTEMETEKCIPTIETLVKKIVGKDLLAQALCHEIDHLNGEVFIDKVEKGTLETVRKEGK